jgi:uncharacterized cupin superfamily protein
MVLGGTASPSVAERRQPSPKFDVWIISSTRAGKDERKDAASVGTCRHGVANGRVLGDNPGKEKSMTTPRKPALDPATVPRRESTIYPAEFAPAVRGRAKRALSGPLGLTQFGANVTELAPGAASALRHWHSHEDEFVFILEGEATLITDEGEQILLAGHCAGFPAGVANGHQLVNKSSQVVRYLEIGSRDPRDEAAYSDVDLRCAANRYSEVVFMRKDGTPIR